MTIICPPPLCARPELPGFTVREECEYVPLAIPTPIGEQRWPEGTRPLVSVSCITFNHEKYIRQAIEGFLMQETTFPVQIVIHDDASTDATASIARTYEEKYPHLIILILQPVNLYSHKITRHIDHLLLGEYVAICEGDDCWIHEQKLNLQVNALEANPHINIVFHPAWLESGKNKTLMAAHSKREIIYPADHVIRGGGEFMPTASIVIRRSVLVSKQAFWQQYGPTIVGDYVTQVLGSHPHGALYLPLCASVYNYGHSGSWSSKIANDDKYYVHWASEVLAMFNSLDLFLNRSYSLSFNHRRRHRIADTLRSCRISLKGKIYYIAKHAKDICKAFVEPTALVKKSFSTILWRGSRRSLMRFDRVSSMYLIKFYLYFKWYYDSAFLPLTPSHKDLYATIHKRSIIELAKFPSLVKCRDFNDRIQWLKLFDQDREIVLCSDKLRVRDRVIKRIGEEFLPRIYQVANHFSEIRIEDLPDQFVIKTNHDSGTVLVVRDKSSLDYEVAKNRFDQALGRAYGWDNGEWAYAYVKPRVFVEEYLEHSSGSPPDYKFYIVEGSARFCHYICNRHESAKEQIIDIGGNDMRLQLSSSFLYGYDFKKPEEWDRMIAVAELIGRGFKCVRVDLYSIANRIVVGEMTFWPFAGLYKGSGQKVLGQLLDFDRSTIKPFLLPTLEAEQSRFSLYSEGL